MSTCVSLPVGSSAAATFISISSHSCLKSITSLPPCNCMPPAKCPAFPCFIEVAKAGSIITRQRGICKDWKSTYKGFPEALKGHCLGPSNGLLFERGLPHSGVKYGLWKSVSPKSMKETRSSEQEECHSKDDCEGSVEKSLCHDSESTINHTGSSELLPTLDAVVVEATELVAETVEVAVQTVSSVGEIEGPILVEQPAMFQAVAMKTVVFWVCAAITFGLIIGVKYGSGRASEFFAGYIVEQSLSVDNLFVFVVIFKYFRVPFPYQSRILTYGISGAIVFRAIMILLGVATIQRFGAVNLFFASVLIFTSYKLLSGGEEEEDDLSNNYIVNTCRKFIPVSAQYDGNKFFTSMEGSLKATPLFLTLAVVELSDIAFAVDSIPAVFGVTRDPLIVFSSNIFAILGLRSLYTLISSSMDELNYLQPSIAVVLGFIGSKMVADFFGFHVDTETSLGVVILVLTVGIGLSFWKNNKDGE